MRAIALNKSLLLSFTLMLFPALALGQTPPPISGRWEGLDPGPNTVYMTLSQNKNSTGQTLPTGAIYVEKDGKILNQWEVQGLLRMSGTGAQTRYRLQMNRWIPVAEFKTAATNYALRDRALREFGDPSRPGMLRGTLELNYNPETSEWRGRYSRIAYTGLGGGLFHEVWENINFGRHTSMIDLNVEAFGAQVVPIGEAGQWALQAYITNPSGTDLVAGRAKIKLQAATGFLLKDRGKLDVQPGWYDLRDSETTLEAIKAGEGAYVRWVSGPQALPGAIQLRGWDGRDRYLRVVVDFGEEIPESKESNNDKALTRVHCDDPKKDIFHVEKRLSQWVPYSSQRDRMANDARVLLPEAYAALLKNVEDTKSKVDAIVCFIRAEGQRRANSNRYTVAGSVTTEKFLDQFFADYLKNPSYETGKAAVDVIGKPQMWPGIGLGPYMVVPESFRRHHGDDEGLPSSIVPASNFFSFRAMGSFHRGDYVATYPYWDIPFLVGGLNSDDTPDADAIGGGRNQTNIMHWATGLKYASIPELMWRELFLGYEYWHLEGFPIFGEDSINDLISEEQGRQWGVRLLGGQDLRTREAMMDAMNDTFEESRAWVGQLLRHRWSEMDKFMNQEKVPNHKLWWTGAVQHYSPWGTPAGQPRDSIRQELAKDPNVMNVIKKSALVKLLIPIHEVMYWPEEFQRRRGRAAPELSQVMINTLEGKYDDQFTDAPKGYMDKWEWRP